MASLLGAPCAVLFGGAGTLFSARTGEIFSEVEAILSELRKLRGSNKMSLTIGVLFASCEFKASSPAAQDAQRKLLKLALEKHARTFTFAEGSDFTAAVKSAL